MIEEQPTVAIILSIFRRPRTVPYALPPSTRAQFFHFSSYTRARGGNPGPIVKLHRCGEQDSFPIGCAAAPAVFELRRSCAALGGAEAMPSPAQRARRAAPAVFELRRSCADLGGAKKIPSPAQMLRRPVQKQGEVTAYW